MREILKEITTAIFNKKLQLTLIKKNGTPEEIGKIELEIKKLNDARGKVMFLLKEEEIKNVEFQRKWKIKYVKS